MTVREFLTSVAASDVSSDVKEKASELLLNMDKANEKKKATPTAKQKENDALKKRILTAVLTSEGPVTASAIGQRLEISTQKAAALLQRMGIEGLLRKGTPTKEKNVTWVAVGHDDDGALNGTTDA